MGTTYERYRQIRIADNLSDQATSVQIAGAYTNSVTQEDLQYYFLSRLNQVIFGTAQPSHHWYEDFLGEGIKSLNELSTGTSSGNVLCLRSDLTTQSSQLSDTLIPAGAIVTATLIDIFTPYSPGTLLEVGQPGNPTLLMGAADNAPTFMNQYVAFQDTPWGPTAFPVVVTIAGSPSVGAGACLVTYTMPNP